VETKGGIRIAEASPEEREWCAELMASSEPWTTLGRGLEKCRAACRHPEYLLLVAHAGRAPSAFILLHPRGVAGSPYVASVAVAPSFRGQGIGTLLLSHAEALFAPGAGHIFLCVSSFNQRARELYERRGYEAVGELKDYIIEGASEILMHKRLARRRA
jgi:ribosomal-protein-alanine N-acetyltransferase